MEYKKAMEQATTKELSKIIFQLILGTKEKFWNHNAAVLV